MDKHMILYRGSLRSCNYHCSYCPFSKNPVSERELEKDRRQWFSFVESFAGKAKVMNIGALMVVPYGEAMIHSWYWEGLAKISALAAIDAVGIQTNLSFSVNDFLDCYSEKGGVSEKLRIWATFHPEMTSVSEFACKCKILRKKGVLLCAGSVGVPENLQLLRSLKQELGKQKEEGNGTYLWVNKMDGLRRSYTQKEREAFLEIDPYFGRELMPVAADISMCQKRLFVEADGRLHTCNISPVLKQNWESLEDFPIPECSRKQCSCYLAYGGREDFMNQILFGPYPLFRIPRRPKAVFLDIEGTLFSAKDSQTHGGGAMDISVSVMAGLEALARENVRLLFATTLPYKEAMERCGKIRHLSAGGIFAGGAHLVLKQEQQKEHFYYIDDAWLIGLLPLKTEFQFRVLPYRNAGKLYKITLLRPMHRPWSRQEAEAMMSRISYGSDSMRYFTRYFIEGNCLQIVAADANKVNGVKTLCRWLGISPREAAAAGDSEEDREMMALCQS